MGQPTFDKVQNSLFNYPSDSKFDDKSGFSSLYRSYAASFCTKPDSLQLKNNIAVALATQHRNGLAEPFLELCRKWTDDNIVLMNSLSNALALQKWNEAKTYLARLGSDNPFISYNKQFINVITTGTSNDILSSNGIEGVSSDAEHHVNSYLSTYELDTLFTNSANKDKFGIALAKRLSYLHAKQENYSLSLKILNEIKARKHRDAALSVNMAMNQLALQQYSKAFKTLNQVDKRYLVYKYYGLGLLNTSKNEFKEASKQFAKALRSDSSFVLAHFGIGRLDYIRGNFKAAEKHYKDALAVNPDCPEALYGIAMVLYESTKNKASFDIYFNLSEINNYLEKLLSRKNIAPSLVYNSNLLYGFSMLKQTLFFDNDISIATNSFDQCIAIAPSKPDAFIGLALCSFIQQAYGEAVGHIDRAISLDTTRAHPYLVKASILYEMEEFEDALSAYQLAFSLDSSNIEIINGLGNCARNMLSFDEAIRYHESSLKLSLNQPNADRYTNNLGVSHYFKAISLGNNQDSMAKIEFEKALRYMQTAFLMSNDSVFLLNMGNVVYDTCQDKKQASQLAFDYFIKSGNRNLRYQNNNTGVLKVLEGNIAQAEILFRNAYRKDDKKYRAPAYNLQLLGKLSDPEMERFINSKRKDELWSRLNSKSNGYLFTTIYHYNYLYRFEIQEDISLPVPFAFLDTPPLPILQYEFLECEYPQKRRRIEVEFKPAKAYIVPQKYDGSCPK